MHSRYEIALETYNKAIHIEAETALAMVRREILPAVIRYTGDVAKTAASIKQYSPAFNTIPEEKLLTALTEETSMLSEAVDRLMIAVSDDKHPADLLSRAQYLRSTVLPAMDQVRVYADSLETMVDRTYWPFPTYADLLFTV